MAFTTIDNPELYFQCKLYSGTGSAQSITLDGSENLSPNFIWQKSRSHSQDARIFDSVRGGSKILYSSLSNAEATDTQLITSFDSDGFTMGTSGSNANDSGTTYVAWNWKAGTTSGLSGGDITPSAYSINTTAKFGIYAYTGNGGSSQTITHGLGATPTCVIFKERGGAEQWRVQHMSAPNPFSKMLLLNASDAEASQTNGLSAVSSTTITFGSDGAYNLNNDTYVCYIFCDVAGYAKMGKYIGNGNADGTFVYTGFRPAWVMCKVASGTTNDWTILDNKRDPFNVSNSRLYANTSGAESDADRADFTANGFKHRGDGNDMNGSGHTYVYMAFAESPFVNSKGVPNNAR